MPILGQDTDLEQVQSNTGTYSYSTVGLDKLGATDYTLVTIAVDTSSSVSPFSSDLEKMLGASVESCKSSPRSDNLLLRVTEFNSHLNQILGWKLLGEVSTDDFSNKLHIGGMTALYDATHEAVHVMEDQAKNLQDLDIESNGIIFIITDGMENNSTNTISIVRKAVQDTKVNEALQSLVIVLVGVLQDDPNDNTKHSVFLTISKELSGFKDEAGIDQYIEMSEVTGKSLAKLAAFISKSVSSQSQSLAGVAFQPQSLSF